MTPVSLDDKYSKTSGTIYLTGIQALVRLLLVQRQRDTQQGLNTAGFISGYRGSPLGNLDLQLWGAQKFLDEQAIHFQPGVNEDLGATAVWGSQQVNLFQGARYDGVFGMWYGKGPGVDRSGDVFKHANAAGSSRYGGVLAIAGDDHACKSSTLPHQSDYAFMDAMIPVLNPAGIQDLLDFGIMGWAMSRYSGCWTGITCATELLDSSATVDADISRVAIGSVEDFEMPPEGLNLRWPDHPVEQEMRLHRLKVYAALAFARANRFDRTVIDSPNPRLGIVTTGKSYLDVRQALDDLGIDADLAAEIGLRVYKVGMSWPLERQGVRAFAEGLQEVLVVEEKRAIIENQFKEQLYNWNTRVRPRVIGKFDEQGEWSLPSTGELTPAMIARVIAARIEKFFTSEQIKQRLAFLERKENALARPKAIVPRLPHFCSGCPHNTSTRVPEGSRAMAGIGCHYMATWMGRNTATFTQMGGEGATWIGQAPFTETRHVFQNLGDGTYFHSGLLAIRAALGAGVNITYKLLYNDAVAMTGGQPVDGMLSVEQITQQLWGEGIRRIAIVSEEPGKRIRQDGFVKGVTFHHRREMDRLQRELREHPGVSVLIYDQVCAAEKRRRRKRGLMEDPATRVFINELVCEGCGDCNAISNCLSVIPIATEFGRKRTINQGACNKDFTCLEGFCPSFVTVHGGQLHKPPAVKVAADDLPAPALPPLDQNYSILITGIGGTGVVTIGALLGMAANLEGKSVAVLDQTGLAQKFGAVVSHLRIGRNDSALYAARIPAGEANLLLACDIVVGSGAEALAKLTRSISRAVVNTHHDMPSTVIGDRDYTLPGCAMRDAISSAVMDGQAHFIEATRLATGLMGGSVTTNIFMVGYAWQQGLIPLEESSILTAIEMNGVAIEQNKQAFRWGRRAAVDIREVEAHVDSGVESGDEHRDIASDLESVIDRRREFLTAYQDKAYARRYESLVRRVQHEEQQRVGDSESRMTEAVARNYFRLLAYKDEYEVARLFTQTGFLESLKNRIDGDFKVHFHLSPPVIARIDPNTGRPRKFAFGSWMTIPFRLLARFRFLRGTRLDLFALHPERRKERQLINDYEQMIATVLEGLRSDNHDIAVEIASLPDGIRGYGPVKTAAIEKSEEARQELMKRFREISTIRGSVKESAANPA